MLKKLFPDRWAVYMVYSNPYNKMLVTEHWFQREAENFAQSVRNTSSWISNPKDLPKIVVERIKNV